MKIAYIFHNGCLIKKFPIEQKLERITLEEIVPLKISQIIDDCRKIPNTPTTIMKDYYWACSSKSDGGSEIYVNKDFDMLDCFRKFPICEGIKGDYLKPTKNIGNAIYSVLKRNIKYLHKCFSEKEIDANGLDFAVDYITKQIKKELVY